MTNLGFFKLKNLIHTMYWAFAILLDTKCKLEKNVCFTNVA